ncbi:hypothetical protein QWZ13_19765 [Reinekea marina]|uniref:Lipoprotein n=1 Tax=Reinekea marina TaxID=1310421 RepID=A0ABV7WV05_9GAMM|nr:hypothetical protein [Reinekea marina]MDN3647350.1 hypothetical protein [Reinekea marina]MDN3651150.1 hypothetical protein [Reinekea marina]
MKKINKSIMTLAFVSAVLMGCKVEGDANSDSNDNQSTSTLATIALSSPTYEVLEEDKTAAIIIQSSALSTLDAGISAALDEEEDPVPSAVQSRKNTPKCIGNDGIATVVVESPNVSTSGEYSDTGSMTVDASFTNCSLVIDNEMLTLNGSFEFELQWDGVISEQEQGSDDAFGFESVVITVTFDDFSSTIDNETTMIQGAVEYTVNDNGLSMEWALAVASPAWDNKIVTTRSTSPYTYSKTGLAGSWIVNGKNNSKVEVSIKYDNEGLIYLVSVNGGTEEEIDLTY